MSTRRECRLSESAHRNVDLRAFEKEILEIIEVSVFGKTVSIFRLFDGRNVEVDEPVKTPESIMMESVLEGMNEYYSQNLAREVMKGLRETAMQCKHTGGKPPLGYDVDPVSKKLVINPVEAEAVRCIFSMYAEGLGYAKILAALNRMGCKTKSGNEFMRNSLYSILTNPKYQGVYVFNRSSAKTALGTRNTHPLKSNEDIITIDGGCPQIVDRETFEKVQTRIEENKHKGGRNKAIANYLLSGKVFCSKCGSVMVGNSRTAGRSKKRYTTYRCPKSRYSRCDNSEINQVKLEQYTSLTRAVYFQLQLHSKDSKGNWTARRKAGRNPK